MGIEYCKASDLWPGDIAVWFDGRHLKSHRVVTTEPSGRFVTRGDLSAFEDLPAGDRELVGRAVSFEILGIRYCLDRGLPWIVGRGLARSDWFRTAVTLTGRLARRALSQLPRE